MPRPAADPGEGSVHGGSRAGASGRVAAVFERGSAGEAALREAGELVSLGRELSVVTLAPQAPRARCCRAGGEGPYNVAIREEASLELNEARGILGSVSARASFKLLAGCPQPPLASWVAEQEFGLVLLPLRRWNPRGNPFASILRKQTFAEVRVVR